MNFSSNINDEQRSSEDEETIKIPIIEEKIHVEKKMVETGKLRVSKTVKEEKQQINIPLQNEKINVERVAVNEYLKEMPAPVRYEGDIMIIPVIREVIEKRIMLVEEIRITKQIIETEENQEMLLRKEEVEINKITNENISS